ncbi:MAG: phenylalanine--tRNA ligase subunit beta [Patescibacteria group bacterium]
MKFSYNWLQSYFKIKLPKPEKLAEILTLHFAEVESVKKVSPEGEPRQRREGGDFVLDIDVRPNRAGDCLSHNGIAREISAILGLKLKISDSKPKESKSKKARNFVDIQFSGKGHCLRYTARVLAGVKVEESPKWIQDRLIACGLRPINNIVDIANYVMLETGQPLHTFDGDKIEDKKIVVRFAKAGEKITTLDGDRVDLDDDILVIADSKSPMAIAGIKGGKIPEIDAGTKIVVLESANFNPQIIRRASRKLNLKTDASSRFEHGLDQNLTEPSADRAAFLIQKIAGGKITKGLIDACPKKVFPKLIKLDLAYVKSLLGVEIPAAEIKRILTGLGFKIKPRRPEGSGLRSRRQGRLSDRTSEPKAPENTRYLEVEIPTRRLDVSLPEDLIEEIGRIHGYEKIPAVFPRASLIPPKRNLDIFWEDMARDALKESDFTETYNYCFISENDKNAFGAGNLIEVENPLSADQKYLRPSLIPNLLKAVQRNHKNFSNIKIFELGKVFRIIAGDIEEKRMLTIAATGEEFYHLKGVADILLNKLGISEIWYDSYKPTPEESKMQIWQEQKCAEIKIGGEEIGFLGVISQKVSGYFKIPQITVLEIDFELLSKFSSEEHEYRPISKFPAAVRDLAILVPKDVKVEDVLNKIESVGGEIIRDVDLFDIYEGDEIPGQKKNLAFHIIFQAENRTLSSEEIEGMLNKIIKALEETPEWQVRK